MTFLIRFGLLVLDKIWSATNQDVLLTEACYCLQLYGKSSLLMPTNFVFTLLLKWQIFGPTTCFFWCCIVVPENPNLILNIQNHSNLNYFEVILPLKQFLLKIWQNGSLWIGIYGRLKCPTIEMNNLNYPQYFGMGPSI